MASMLWDSTLVTGHTRMDADHVELAGLFDLLREAVEQSKGKEFCGMVLDQIIEYAGKHFDLEQQLMAKHRYPGMEVHTAEHAMLLAQVLEYRGAFDALAAAPKIALIDFPDVWLGFHILFSDKDLALFLARTR